MLVIMFGSHKMLVCIANREDPDHTASEKTLIRLLFQKQSDLGLHCLSEPFFSRQLVFKILEHLLYIERKDFRSSLIWVCTVCLSLIGRQLVFKILEHLPYIEIKDFRGSLIWVCTVCLSLFGQATSVRNFRTFTIY